MARARFRAAEKNGAGWIVVGPGGKNIAADPVLGAGRPGVYWERREAERAAENLNARLEPLVDA